MEDGRRQMVGLLLPSDFVGRPGRQTAPFDVVAATEVVLCRFQKTPFESLLTTTPSVGARLLEMTLDELDSAREWMLLLGRKTAREKIASVLHSARLLRWPKMRFAVKRAVVNGAASRARSWFCNLGGANLGR